MVILHAKIHNINQLCKHFGFFVANQGQNHVEFVDNLNLPSELKELFMMLGNFDSKAEDLNNAKTKAANYPAVYDAICSLENLAKYLDIYGISKYISFELGLISDYHYYTGIIFSGYTFGTGEPILKGGRYDKLLSHFGKEAAAIGFGIVVDQLMAALNRQDISLPINNNSTIIVYTQNKAEEAITHAIKLRKQSSTSRQTCWSQSSW